MLSKTTISKRIWMGFGLSLLITVILGLLAVGSMQTVRSKVFDMANEYVPEVTVANNVERTALSTISDAIAFSLSQNRGYLDSGKKKLAEVNKFVEEAKNLASRSQLLSKLSQGAETAQKESSVYAANLEQLSVQIEQMTKAREAMDAAGAMFVNLCWDYLHSQNDKLQGLLDTKGDHVTIRGRAQKMWEINQVIDAGNTIQVANFKAQAVNDPKIIENEMGRFDEIASLLNHLISISVEKEHVTLLKNVGKAAEAYRENVLKFAASERSVNDLREKLLTSGNTVLNAAKATAEAGIQDTTTIAQASMSELARALVVLFVGLILAVVLGVVVSFFSARSITGPINEVTATLQDANHEVSSATRLLSDSSRKLSSTAYESAASLEETSSSMERFASMVQRNAQNAREVSSLASESKKSAETGDIKIRSLIEAMNDIVKGSRKIEEIVTVIDDIAFQTNLLALNAAVEAARAGEHGKGFAVVAEAVRNLAQKSAAAAKEISSIIKENVSYSDNGARMATESGHSLQEIVVSSKKVADLIAQIADASSEQSLNIEQISKAIAQIDAATQENAATAEESAATSEDLSHQTDRLDHAVRILAAMTLGSDIGVDTNRTGDREDRRHIEKAPKESAAKTEEDTAAA